MKRKHVALALLILGFFAVALSIAFSPALKKQFNKVATYVGEHDDVFLMYQNLANPYVRYVKIPEGLRKEEVAMIYEKNLSWNENDVNQFLSGEANKANLEGYYFPSTYVLAANADGESVKDEMIDKFNQNLTNKVDKSASSLNKNVINVDTALKIASLIQREAGGTNDMNLISGIIWNRIWNGMSLDIDATLQYAKGNSEDGWWPEVHSDDKKIDSPYNTYLNAGLPPSPIANPGTAAIEAAYNPAKTDCLFYLHDSDHNIHCSRTYEEHKALVEQYLK